MSDPRMNLSLGGAVTMGLAALAGIGVIIYDSYKKEEPVEEESSFFSEIETLDEGVRIGISGNKKFVLNEKGFHTSRNYDEIYQGYNGEERPLFGKLGGMRYLLNQKGGMISKGYEKIIPMGSGYEASIDDCIYRLNQSGEIVGFSKPECKDIPRYPDDNPWEKFKEGNKSEEQTTSQPNSSPKRVCPEGSGEAICEQGERKVLQSIDVVRYDVKYGSKSYYTDLTFENGDRLNLVDGIILSDSIGHELEILKVGNGCFIQDLDLNREYAAGDCQEM